MNYLKPYILSLCCLFAIFNTTLAQSDDVLQFSGLIMTGDSLGVVPYTTVVIKGTTKGTIADYQGFFSFVANKGDVIRFTAIGYKAVEYTIPTELEEKRYSIIQLMSRDTVTLAETVIYPWPSKEEFKEAFLALDIPDDDLERAKKNLDRERLIEIGQYYVPDGAEASKTYLRGQAQKFYWMGQRPPQNIFNPFAWAKFIQDWKDGKFKKKK